MFSFILSKSLFYFAINLLSGDCVKTAVCPYCGFGCRLLIDPKTMKVKPHRGEPNRGKLCPKGLHATEFVLSDDRLRRPPQENP